MKRIFQMLALAVLVTLVPVAGASADHSWDGSHWARTVGAVSLPVVTSITSDWTLPVAGAIADWSVSEVIDLAQVPGDQSSRARKRCQPIARKVRVCNAAYGRNGWLGLGEIWVDSANHIVQARTRLNDTYYRSSTYGTDAWRNLVACQEIGHDFGLDHQDENSSNVPLGTCMDYTNDPEPNQHPNAHDYQELASIYAHVDGIGLSGRAGSHRVHSRDVAVTRSGRYTKLTWIHRTDAYDVPR